MKMPFPENSFDAVYAIEATCHAPDAVCTLNDIIHGRKFALHIYTFYLRHV